MTLLLLLAIQLVLATGSPPTATFQADDAALETEIQSHVDEWRFVSAMEAAVAQIELRSMALGWEHLETLASLQRAGEILVRSNTPWALEILEGVLPRLEAQLPPDDPRLADCWYWIGRATRLINTDPASHQSKSAQSWNTRARELLEATGQTATASYARVLQQDGSLLRRARHHEDASLLYRRALETLHDVLGPEHIESLTTENWLAHVLRRAGQVDEALARFRSIRSTLEGQGRAMHPLMQNVEGNLIGSAFARGENVSIDRILAAASVSDAAWPELALRRGRRAETSLFGESRVETLLDQERGASAWKLVERSIGRAAESGFWLARVSNDNPQIAARLAVLQRRLLRATERRAQVAEKDWPQSAFERLQSEIDLIVEEQRLLKDSPVFGADLSRVQATLRPGSAMVGWIDDVLGRRSIVYVIRDRGPVEWIRSGIGAGQKAWREIINTLWRSAEWPTRLPEDPLLRDMLQAKGALLGGLLSSHLADIDHLVLLPNFSNWADASAMLAVTDDPALDRIAISFSPSAMMYALQVEARTGKTLSESSIVAVSQETPLGTEEGLDLAVAGPGSVPRAALEDRVLRDALNGEQEAWVSLPPLPLAGRETQAVATMFARSKRLVGDDASEEELRRVLKESDGNGVLHVATHALIDKYKPERSILALTPGPDSDGRLTAREIELGLPMDLALLTLSGCQTGLGSLGNQRPTFGLFEYCARAGVRSALVSRWKVDDAATCLLMERFYQNATGSYEDERDGPAGSAMTKARALRESQQWLRHLEDGDGNRLFAHPVYWAGFFLLGDPY